MTILHLLLIYCSFLTTLQNARASPIVYINGSYILGQQNSFNGTSVNEFLGIPYAEPPVGPLRFQKPKPIQSYPTVFEAFTNPPECPQYTTQAYPGYNNSAPKSEDCLYLNIWTPADASPTNKKAVLYWIHGGGFRYGSIRSDGVYSGIPLASLGNIIVVTVNYRLGALGFLTTVTEDAPSNVGLYDILEGLKWVNKYIEAFGGDVRRITISGESAGSVASSFFTISPLAKGLYTRLIMESGTAVAKFDGHGSNDVFAQNLAQKVGCANETYQISLHPKAVVQCLRGVDSESLSRADFEINPLSINSFIPQFGDELLPNDPVEAILKGNFRCKDLLIGSNKDEGSLTITFTNPQLYGFFGEKDPQLNKTMGRDTVKTFLSKALPHSTLDVETILQRYFPDNLPEKAHNAIRHQVLTAVGDIKLICPDIYYAEKCAEQNQNVYSYFFTHRPSVTPWAKWMGVAHFDEVQFVFGQPLLNPKKYQASEVTLSRQIIELWSNFVKTGKPDGSWPLYSRENPFFTYLGPKTVTGRKGKGPHPENCNLLRPFYEEV